MSLDIHSLSVSVGGREILHSINLCVPAGEVHVIMGPNGSGKSTLANALMGHPNYLVTQGNVFLDEENITGLKVSDKAKKGLFLSMQYAPEISGVTIGNFLRTAVSAMTGVKQHPIAFYKRLTEKLKELDMDPAFASRYLNVGFSGGEKKRMEILQLLLLSPRYAILDETDSGLDVDALKIVSNGINRFRSDKTGILLITHYNRILEYVKPDIIHIMVNGTIVKTGAAELARTIEEEGYASMILTA